MSRKEKSIELLNKAVADELLAVHQYMYFHFRCDDMGYDLLSGLFKRTAIQEMMHVEQLSERILFLKGEVEMKTSGDVQKIHEPKEMLELATAMEEGNFNATLFTNLGQFVLSLVKRPTRRQVTTIFV